METANVHFWLQNAPSRGQKVYQKTSSMMKVFRRKLISFLTPQAKSFQDERDFFLVRSGLFQG